MKLLVVFILLSSWNVYAQPTTTGCCKFQEQVIPDDSVATACLLCGDINITKKEDLLDFAGPENNAEEVKAAEISINTCHLNQNILTQKVAELIHDFSEKKLKDSEGKEIKNLDIAVQTLKLIRSSELADLMNKLSLKAFLELEECNSDDEKKKSISTFIQKSIIKVKEIKQIYENDLTECTNYTTSEKEKKISESIDDLISLDTDNN